MPNQYIHLYEKPVTPWHGLLTSESPEVICLKPQIPRPTQIYLLIHSLQGGAQDSVFLISQVILMCIRQVQGQLANHNS